MKFELAREHPKLKFAYSRPGFLTFKLPYELGEPEAFRLKTVFGRSWGFSLGKATGSTLAERAATAKALFEGLPVTQLHVFQRDLLEDPDDERVAGRTPLALEAEVALLKEFGDTVRVPPLEGVIPCQPDELCADCVLVEPNEWWLGWHIIRRPPEHWPGGVMPGVLPPEAVSRGWLKMREMLLWSELPVRRGEVCIEFGSSPGGASQQLLGWGLEVIGVDPAEMHPTVLADSHFQHLQARPRDLKRKVFLDIDWLVSDINLPPRYTLDTLEAIVKHPGVAFQGMLLTLKLPDWKLIEEIPDNLKRIRSWGYRDVRARQLYHNRQEICVKVWNREALGVGN